MSLASPVIFDNGLARPMLPGDVLNSNERVYAYSASAAGITMAAQDWLNSLLSRSGAVAVSDATPDSASWINALLQNSYVAGGALNPAGVNPGTSYRVRLLNSNTGTLTITAGTGVTLTGTMTIATLTARDFLVTVLNGTPQQVFAASTTNASAVVTGMSAAQTQLLSPGMLVTGTGIPAATTVLSVQPGVGVTLSANATATGSLVALTFNPRIEVRSIGGIAAF